MTEQTTQTTSKYAEFTNVIRTMTRTAYDLQGLRIQMGNRVAGNFRAKLGMKPDGMTEAELEKEEKGILEKLRASYARITDGIIVEGDELVEKGKLPTEKKFKGDELITNYGELLMVDNYMEMLAHEGKHFRDMGKVLKKIPIYTEFLEKVEGIGPAMAGVIISEIDIHKAQYVSSLWKLAGLDTVRIGVYTDDSGNEKFIRGQEVDAFYANPENEGMQMLVANKWPVTIREVGRSRKDFCLVKRSYIPKDQKDKPNPQVKERDSITFNPFLKTKLVGVLATSFLRGGKVYVNDERMSAAKRLALAVKLGFTYDKKDEAFDVSFAVNDFLRGKGYQVDVQPTHFGQSYVDYRRRISAMPAHAEKTALHKHNMALRYMTKRFLAELYREWRTLEDLVVAPEYSEAKLGLVHGVATESKNEFYRNRNTGK